MYLICNPRIDAYDTGGLYTMILGFIVIAVIIYFVANYADRNFFNK